MDLADGYSFKSAPKSQKLILPEDSGSYTIMARKKENYYIQLRSQFVISKPKYFRFEYQELKELFRNVVVIQNTDIVIEKDTQIK